MTYDRKVSIEYANREWSVYVRDIHDGLSTEDCIHCGAKAKDDYCGKHFVLNVEIVEMYDENGIEAKKNSKAFRYAKELLKADGKSWPVCTKCRNR